MSQSRFDVSKDAGAVTLELSEQWFRPGEARALRDAIHEVIQETGRTEVSLSFVRIQGINSEAIGALMMLRARLKTLGRYLTLTGMNDQVLRLFRACRLDDVFVIRECTRDGEGQVAAAAVSAA